MKPQVALCFPRRAPMRQDHMIGSALHASPKGACQVYPFAYNSSLLNSSFNNCLVWAVNQYELGLPITHLAIIHDDIQADPGWLDTHMKTLESRDADLVSSAVPIKTVHGVSSTGAYRDDIWDFRRFTMRELGMMPDVFTSDEYDGNLLLNTGCCLMQLRDPWLSHPDRFVFQDIQRNIRQNGGPWVNKCISEDWLFTDAIAQTGARVAVSRKVGILHEGTHNFSSGTDWGTWQTDEHYVQSHGASNENQVPAGLQVRAERLRELASV